MSVLEQQNLAAEASKPLEAAADVLDALEAPEAPAEPNAKAKPKMNWKGAVEGLKKTGAMGASKRWTSVIQEIKATTEDLDKYDASQRKHSYAATIGTAKREGAAPAPCPVHAYNSAVSTLRRGSATFGKAPLDKPPATAGPAVHSYSAMGSTFTPKAGATFGKASTGRGVAGKSACNVAYYSAPSTASSTMTLGRSPMGGTFGKAAARPGSVAMTRTGLLLSSKPAALPPLEPLTCKSRTAAASHAIGFANKLKRAVASSESVGAAPAADQPQQQLRPRSASADILVIDQHAGSSGEATPATLSGEATPMEAAAEEIEQRDGEPSKRHSDAAQLALELLKEESVSPVKRKLAMARDAAAALEQAA